MPFYRITLRGYDRRKNESATVVLVKEGPTPKLVVQNLGTVYVSKRGEVNTTGGFGYNGGKWIFDEWEIVSIRVSRAKAHL